MYNVVAVFTCATEHVKWDESELRWAVSVKYTLDFEYVGRKKYTVSSINECSILILCRNDSILDMLE